MGREAWQQELVTFTVKKQRERDAAAQPSFFLCLLPRTPAHRMVPSPFKGESFHLSDPRKTPFMDMRRRLPPRQILDSVKLTLC